MIWERKVLIAVGVVVVGVGAALGLSDLLRLDYEWAYCFAGTRAVSVPREEGWEGEADLVPANDPGLLTILWVRGQGHSRLSTAHGHFEKLALTVRHTIDEYGETRLTPVSVFWWGYHPGWLRGLEFRGLEDVWVNLEEDEEGIRADATIRVWEKTDWTEDGPIYTPQYRRFPELRLKPRPYDRTLVNRKTPI